MSWICVARHRATTQPVSGCKGPDRVRRNYDDAHGSFVEGDLSEKNSESNATATTPKGTMSQEDEYDEHVRFMQEVSEGDVRLTVARHRATWFKFPQKVADLSAVLSRRTRA